MVNKTDTNKIMEDYDKSIKKEIDEDFENYKKFDNSNIPRLILFLLILSSLVVGCVKNNYDCTYDNKKILDMYLENEVLKIKFEDCSDCEHYWNCWNETETWFFETEDKIPTHIEVGDYVVMCKGKLNNTYHSHYIEKIS